MRHCHPQLLDALDQIHESIVVVPIDKATNNVALVCGHFYVSRITKESDRNNNGETTSYKEIKRFIL